MIDVEKRALVVKGAVPGKPGTVLEITPNKVSSEDLANSAILHPRF